MSWLRWLQRRWLHALGWQGIAGLGLMAASAMAWLAAIAPLETEVASLRLEATATHADARRPRDSSDMDPAAQLQAFYAFFRHDESLEAWLARLHGLGERNGLALRQARYEPAEATAQDLRLSRYRITVPVTASYPQLRGFLAAALTQIPVLSLDQLALHRNQAGDARVEARLQFTLYLAPPS